MSNQSGLTHEFLPELLADPELGPVAKRAARTLDEVAGRTAAPARAVWSKGSGANNTPVIKLKLWDDWGSIDFETVPRVLSSDSEMRYTLIRLWGDLLELRSHNQLDSLVEAGTAEG